MITNIAKMIYLHGFESFNAFVGLPEPLAGNIDAGSYDQGWLLPHIDPLVTDFYRILINTSSGSGNGREPIHPVAFTGPNVPIHWNETADFKGVYLQVSQKMMKDHRRLFNHQLPELRQQRFFLTGCESNEIAVLSNSLIRHLQTKGEHDRICLSYVHVLLSLIESACYRQLTKNERIRMIFQKLINGVNRFYSGVKKYVHSKPSK